MAEVRHHLLPPPPLVLLSEQLLLLLVVVLLHRDCRSIIGPHRRCEPTRLSSGCSTSVVALNNRL